MKRVFKIIKAKHCALIIKEEKKRTFSIEGINATVRNNIIGRLLPIQKPFCLFVKASTISIVLLC